MSGTTTPRTADHRGPSLAYAAPPLLPRPVYADGKVTKVQGDDKPPQSKPIPAEASPKVQPWPPTQHGITYIVVKPYLSHEIDHLSVVPLDTLVDVTSHTPHEETLPYPAAFNSPPKQYWQASLGHRRGPRGLFPYDIMHPVVDERVSQRLCKLWFAEKDVNLIADAHGRVWVGPSWEFKEPSRRRSKWWAHEF
jgi:hypothetical protein